MTCPPANAPGCVRPESVMFGLGIPELVVFFAIVVVLFGARRLPEIGAGVGKAIKNFKAGVSGDDEIDVTPEKEKVSDGDSSSGN